MILGIDPGLTGGWALLTDRGGFVGADDLPISRDGKTAWVDAAELKTQIRTFSLASIERGPMLRAVVERVHSMPKQGVASSFTFGVGFGSVLATLQLLPASVEFVTPSVWKHGIWGCQKKAASLDKARLLFPEASLQRKKDNGRAEALLIAFWACRGGSDDRS